MRFLDFLAKTEKSEKKVIFGGKLPTQTGQIVKSSKATFWVNFGPLF